MKRRMGFVLIVVALAGAAVLLAREVMPPRAEAAALDAEQANRATRFLELLDKGDDEEALAMVSPGVRAKLVEADFANVWRALPQQLGVGPRSAPRGEALGGRPIVTFRLAFSMMPLDARITFDARGLIDGFRIVPAQAPPPPAVAAGARMRERDLNVASAAGPLAATLALPDGARDVPGVVLVHGSGPHDRDATIGPNRPFLELARGLAERGIAALRYEKRTKAYPESFAAEFTVDDETVDDAVAAVAALRAIDGVDPRRVFVLGHSLGGMLAPRIAARSDDVAGLVLMAAPTRKLEDVVVEQLRYLAALDGTVDATEQAAIDDSATRRDAVKALSGGATGASLPLDLPAAYWRDLSDYDPMGVARALPQPLLILRGERDYQVTAEDLAAWKAALGADPRVTIRSYPGLNHLFAAGDGPPRPDEYFQPNPVASTVIDDIAGWIGAIVAGAATPAVAGD